MTDEFLLYLRRLAAQAVLAALSATDPTDDDPDPERMAA